MTSAAPTSAPSRAPWLFSAPLDLLVGCGAWSLPLLALIFWLQQAHGEAVALGFYGLALFCNNPHYMATIYRAYHTAADFRKYRFFTVYVTILLALSVALVHLAPRLFPWVITLYLTWSPWHYTGQNFGIAQMLVRRAGGPPDRAARQWLFASYTASYALWFLTLHTWRPAVDPYFVSLNIPEAVALPAQVALFLVFAGCSAIAFRRLERTLAVRVLIGPLTLTATQVLWFVAPTIFLRLGGAGLPVSYFSAGALAFMHCAQYLWVTSYYARHETPASGAVAARRSFAHYYLILVIGGIALFIPGPWIASRVLGLDHVRSFMIFLALVNLHHFILDGAIWKLRDGRIARLLLGTNVEGTAEHERDVPSLGHHLGWLFGSSRPARVMRIGLALVLLALGALDLWQYGATSRLAPAPVLMTAAAINPADPRAAFRLAQSDLAQGNLPGATARLRALVAQNPDNAPAQFLLGEILMRSGDAAGTFEHYSDLFTRFPRDAGVARNRGLAALTLGDHASAQASFERVIRLDPSGSLAHLLLARVLAARGDSIQAITAFEVGLTSYETAPEMSGESLDLYFDSSLAQASLLSAANAPADLARAERRLQRASTLAMTRQRYAWASRLLDRLAEIQDVLGRPFDADRSRQLSQQAAKLASTESAHLP